jgi:hypothetical protein
VRFGAAAGLLVTPAIAASAQDGPPPSQLALARIGPAPGCAYGPQDPDAIVVCGRRGQGMRVPGARPGDQDYRGEQSWGARVGTGDRMRRWGSQTVGPFGYLQHSQQIADEWRAARAQIRAGRYR